jgi:transcriptional regulator with XRE-family HTH domain
MGRRLGVSHDRLARLERGEEAATTIDLTARYAAVLGMTLATTLHPDGDVVRDQAHVALLGRFHSRLPRGAIWRTEVPMPITGDPRSADGLLALGRTEWLAEAETHLGDFQALERRMAAKGRDLGTDRLVLVLADTAHHRRLLRGIPALRERFPIDTRTFFRAIAKGEDPGADAAVIV